MAANPMHGFRDELAQMRAYTLPEVPAGVKLDAMESPFDWPGDLEALWLSHMSKLTLNRYPDQGIAQLHQVYAQELGLTENQGIILGNGSDELIQLLCLACAKPGACIWTPSPSFSMYQIIAQAVGLRFTSSDVTRDFALPAETALADIEREQPALIFLALPNNPTGNGFDESVVREIVSCAPGWVVLDEAYCAFAQTDYASWLHQYPNVMVLRTLSKMGLAGIRLGYLAGPKAAVTELNKLRLPYNINTMSAQTALFAAQYRDRFIQQAECIKQYRETLRLRLSACDAIQVWPSQANFLLFRLLQGDAQSVQRRLQQQAIWIKCLDGVHALLKNCFRVSIGTETENETFYQGLMQSIDAQA